MLKLALPLSYEFRFSLEAPGSFGELLKSLFNLKNSLTEKLKRTKKLANPQPSIHLPLNHQTCPPFILNLDDNMPSRTTPNHPSISHPSPIKMTWSEPCSSIRIYCNDSSSKLSSMLYTSRTVFRIQPLA